LDLALLPLAQPFILTVEWNGVKFEFLMNIKPNTSNLLILGSEGMDQTKARILPYFQRHSWINDFEDSTIYYNDPTLYLGDHLLLGWGQGTRYRFYLQDIAAILTKLIQKIGMDPNNVLFYGSSGGGFMSLILAGYIRGSMAIVNSPQTCLTKWLPVPVQDVFNLAYPRLTQEEIMNLYPERINVIKFYNQIKYVPKILYLQNVYCEYDVVGHLLPFIEGLQKIEDGSFVNNVTVELYYDKQPGPAVMPEIGGHGALGKYETLNYINQSKNPNTFMLSLKNRIMSLFIKDTRN
jgi:hypothetical protein